MSDNNPSSLLYRRRFESLARFEPLPDYDEAVSHQAWPPQPPATPDFRSGMKRPNDEGYDRRHQPLAARTRSLLADDDFPRREMADIRPDFVRDGWSPEPPQREHAQMCPAVLDMSFRERFPPGHVTISYSNEMGDVERIHGINQETIEGCSFLLSQAIDGSGLFLEACNSLTIRPFLQYLYTGTYHLPSASGQLLEDVPTSLLVHCQMFRLGDIYDIPDLKSLANVQIIRQCEFGCSSPDRPVDLCAAIDYIYNNMREHVGVLETIVAYCVTCFSTHGLSDDFEFRRLAFDLRPFHQDLCKVGMERRFEDDHTAQAIIQMPFKPYTPATYASREDRRAKQIFDDVYHFHGDDGDLAHSHQSQRVGRQHFPVIHSARPAVAGSCARDAEIGRDSATEHSRVGQSMDLPHRMFDQTVDVSDLQRQRRPHDLSLRQKRQLPYETKRDGSECGKSTLEEEHALFWRSYERLETSDAPTSSNPVHGQDRKKSVKFEEKPAELSSTVIEEPKVEVSRKLFNDLVAAGLTGKPGPQADHMVRRAANDRVRELCAALAKEELHTARADAEYELISAPASRGNHDPGSDSDSDFVKIEPDPATDTDVEVEQNQCSTVETGSGSDSEWDMVQDL